MADNIHLLYGVVLSDISLMVQKQCANAALDSKEKLG
jgi:hypothetical protein